MKKRPAWLYVLCGVTLAVAAGLSWILLHGRMPKIESPEPVARTPRISPDYAGVVIPPNIAPLNFVVKEPGEMHYVMISSTHGEPIHIRCHDARVSIPLSDWHELLDANRGEALTIDVYVRNAAGDWRRFAPIVNTVAEEDVDGYLVYREMSVYNLMWTDMGIYQRDLRSFDRTEVLRNTGFGSGCCNCHTFLKNRPNQMLMNVRGPTTPKPGDPKGGMVIVRDGVVQNIVNTKTDFNPIPAIYIAWHPSGRAVSFSTNKVLQRFHTVGPCRDVVDAYSDVGLYLLDTNTVTTSPDVSRADRMEAYPAWSPDGEYMYFCSAPQYPMVEGEGGKATALLFKDVRYDLVRIRYDIDTDTWGKLETVLSAEELKLSISLPRISPDGRFLLCCMMNFGNFAAFNPTSDLYMLDLRTRRLTRLDINSDSADAYHSWSSNGRWIVFSSKRLDGELARPYISYVDETGKAHKPVLLPQKDPAFYDGFIRVFNVPEFVTEPISVTQRDILKALHAPDMTIKAKLAPGIKPNPTTLKAMKYGKPSPIQ